MPPEPEAVRWVFCNIDGFFIDLGAFGALNVGGLGARAGA